jgi:hypothetical protein
MAAVHRLAIAALCLLIGGKAMSFPFINRPTTVATTMKRRTTAMTILQAPPHRVPNVVAPNSAFWVEGCERQYCGGASTWAPSSAAACQPQRGS